jgi:hypothetical protein
VRKTSSLRKKNSIERGGNFTKTARKYQKLHIIKGIFQPFELGGVTRLIRSAVKFWKAGN